MELFDKNSSLLSLLDIKLSSNSKDNDEKLLILKMNWNQIYLISKDDNAQYNKNTEYYKMVGTIPNKLLYFIERFVK